MDEYDDQQECVEFLALGGFIIHDVCEDSVVRKDHASCQSCDLQGCEELLHGVYEDSFKERGREGDQNDGLKVCEGFQVGCDYA